jgi:hypothetical protein
VVRYLLYPYMKARYLFAFYAAIGVLFLTSNASLGRRFGLAGKQAAEPEATPRPQGVR